MMDDRIIHPLSRLCQNQEILSSFLETTHVFVIRIWSEPREIIGADPAVRIYIEHVSSGVHHYLTELGEIPTVILSMIDKEDTG
jgi:hypothetical protein